MPALTRRHPALLDTLLLSLIATEERYAAALRGDAAGAGSGDELDGGSRRSAEGDEATGQGGADVDAVGSVADPSAFDPDDGSEPADDSAAAASLAMENFVASWSPEVLQQISAQHSHPNAGISYPTPYSFPKEMCSHFCEIRRRRESCDELGSREVQLFGYIRYT